MAAWKQRHTHREAERKRKQRYWRAAPCGWIKGGATTKGKVGFPTAVWKSCNRIVMRAWLAVTGVPPVVHCRKTGLSAVALSAMEGKLVLRHGALLPKMVTRTDPRLVCPVEVAFSAT